MAQTYTQIQRQIEALQKQADKLKQSEVSGVVERIKVAIAHYDLTPDQLFGTSTTKPSKVKSGKAAGKSGGVKNAGSAAYADDHGNVWGGRGPRPKWLREAIAGGKSLDGFATSAKTTSLTATKAKKQKPVASKRKATQYSDDSGNSWSGFGPRPGWLKTALAAGRSLEDFAGPPKN